MVAVACAAQRSAVVRPEVQPDTWPAIAASADIEQARSLLQANLPGMTGAGVVIESVPSVAAVEAASLKEIAKCGRCPQVPFGFAHKQWIAFAQRIKSGDTVVFVRNSELAWSSLFGVEGYALIRNGRFVEMFVTLVS
jgi:hypothetical protein